MRRTLGASLSLRGLSCFGPLLLLVSSGCTQSLYEVDMTIEGDTVQRTVTASMSSGSEEKHGVSAEEEQRLSQDYEEPVTRDDRGRSIVRGEFIGQLPNDVGGQGEMVRWETSLGNLSVYLERFRGSDDLHAQLTDRLTSLDLAVDLLSAWIDMAAVDTEEGQQLREFIAGEFREDARNLSLLLWMSQTNVSEGSEESEQLLAARMIQYGVEHGYFSLREIPQLHSPIPAGGQATIRRVLSHKLEVDDITRVLPALVSEESLEKSLDEEFGRSQAFEKYLRQHEDRIPHHITAGRLPSEILIELGYAAIGISWQSHDALVVRLRIPVEPFATNGQWREKGLVEWTANIAIRDAPPPHSPPTINYAAWSQPDKEAQQARFGRVLLEGESLGKYVFWQQSLAPEVAQRWEEFLANLSPDDDLARRLQKFGESISAEEADLTGCDLLESALGRK